MERRRGGGQAGPRERLLAGRAMRARQLQRYTSGSVPEPTGIHVDEMKDNEIGPKRPKFIDASNSSALPLTTIQFHNDIVRRRNANMARVLNNIRDTDIPIAFGVRGGRRGLFVNNMDRNLAQRYDLVAFRRSDNDEKTN
jgi:hypothetical protein